jgi:outer membrane protein
MHNVHTLITTLAVPREESRASKAFSALAAPDSDPCFRSVFQVLRLIGLGCDRFSLSPASWKFPAFPKNSKEFKIQMISKIMRVATAMVFGLSLYVFAQAPAAGAAAPATTPNAPSATAAAPKNTGSRIGTLNVEQAIFASNEGRRDVDALIKKFEPKQNELKGLADEIDSLKKQLSAQQDKLNDESRDKLVKQIESKQKSFDRASQDAQEDFRNQQQEIASRILGKMAPLIQKYVADNGYGLLLDSSQPWPQGPVIVSGPSIDITQPIVEAFNTQSGVPAPAASSTPAKPAPKPATKPATTAPPKQ